MCQGKYETRRTDNPICESPQLHFVIKQRTDYVIPWNFRDTLTDFAVPIFRDTLRAASPKYQLDLEIAEQSNFSKLAQNEALRALATKILFEAR